MKILMTAIAALAISSAVSAQTTECTFTSATETETRVFDGLVRVVQNGDGVNIVDIRSGEVLDFVEFGGDRFGARCSSGGSSARRPSGFTRRTASTSTTSTTPSAPVNNVSSQQVTESASSTPSSGSSSSRRGFPASAAISGSPNAGFSINQ